MKTSLCRLLSLAGWLGLGVIAARAQSVPLTAAGNNLYNTGYSGTVLAGSNQVDTHYDLIGGTAYQMNPLGGGYVANPGDAQWINPSPTSDYVALTTFDYRLNLTNIPANQLVTIAGMVAVDDGLTIVANGTSTIFSNSNTVYTNANYTALSPFASATFVSGTTNTLDFLVSNIGGVSGLLLELNGSYVPVTSGANLSVQLHPQGLNANQQAIIDQINEANAAGVSNPGFSTLTTQLTLLGLANGNVGAALDQLSPQAFGQFARLTAFNNASFAIEQLDNYLDTQRGPAGAFLAGSSGIDASGLTVNDPDYDPNLSMVHSRLLAWNPAPASGVISDVADPMLGGVDMKNAANPSSLAPQDSHPWNVYVRGSVVLAEGSAGANVSQFNDNTETVVLGADYRITPHFLVGVDGGYGHTGVTLDGNGSSARNDSYSPGVYASYADQGWYANLAANYDYNTYTQSRVIPFLGETAGSAPAGNEEVADLDGGYDFHRGALTFGPLAGVQYTHLEINGYSESGSVADLNVNQQDADSLRSRLGGRVSYTFSRYGVNFTPHADASWQHEFMDQSRGITSQFQTGGLGSFSVQTDNASRDSALVDAGLDADINRSLTLFADYEAQAGQSNYFGQSVQAGLKIGF